nr:DUF6057 family protein [uncultured Draconibacterium sp.]
MNSVPNKSKIIFRFFPVVLLFLFAIVFLHSFTDYIFFYQEKSSLFQLSFSFLKQHLDQPGGFMEYLGKLQMALYFYPLLGAFIVSSQILLIIWLISRIGKQLGAENFLFVPFLAGALLFYLQTNYQYQAINNLGILFQLLLFLGLIINKPKYQWLVVVELPVVYFLFGSFSYLLLGLLTIYFLYQKSWLKAMLSWIGLGFFFWIGKEFLFFYTTDSLLVFPFSETGIGGQVVLFGVTAFLLLFVQVLARIRINAIERIKIRKIKLGGLSPYLILVLLVIVAFQNIDEKSKHYFHAEKLFYEQKYDELIEFNMQFPTKNTLTAFLNNVALAETGRLSNSFFHFPQSSNGNSLFLKWELVTNVLERGGYFYYAVGMINEAQRWAYEYMVMKGNSPEVLKMLIKTELIKGNYKVAEKYISVLGRTFFHRKEAKAFQALLFNDKAIAVHPELGRRRMLDTKVDFFVHSDNPLIDLESIVEADSMNIPALEYKLARLMLQKDVVALAEMLPVMEKAGYKRIPKNVEEAVASYSLLDMGDLPDTRYLSVSEPTKRQFREFFQIFMENRSDKQRAQKALARYSNTYWYYVFFK